MALAKAVVALWIFTFSLRASAGDEDRTFPPAGYNKKERPFSHQDKGLNVSLHLWVESFGSIDIAKMEYEIYGYIILRWSDPRLKHSDHDDMIYSGSDINPIWVPDIYCVNCRDSTLESGRNEKQSMVIISKDGSIYYSVGVKLVASCPIDLVNFPFDFQRCPLNFCSYSYNATQLLLSWHGQPTIVGRLLEQFDIVKETVDVNWTKYSSGYFTVAGATFGLSRRIGFYALQIYVPTIMLVCLSWSVFFMRTSTIGERITIGVTLFLAMVFLHGYSNASLPKVSYIKAVDWFIVVSLASILLIILESILTEKLWKRQEHSSEETEMQIDPSELNGISSPDHLEEKTGDESSNAPITMVTFDIENGITCNKKASFLPGKCSRESYVTGSLCQTHLNGVNAKRRKGLVWKLKNCKQDVVAITVFPSLYFAFNIWYWIHFTSMSNGTI